MSSPMVSYLLMTSGMMISRLGSNNSTNHKMHSSETRVSSLYSTLSSLTSSLCVGGLLFVTMCGPLWPRKLTSTCFFSSWRFRVCCCPVSDTSGISTARLSLICSKTQSRACVTCGSGATIKSFVLSLSFSCSSLTSIHHTFLKNSKRKPKKTYLMVKHLNTSKQ